MECFEAEGCLIIELSRSSENSSPALQRKAGASASDSTGELTHPATAGLRLLLHIAGISLSNLKVWALFLSLSAPQSVS